VRRSLHNPTFIRLLLEEQTDDRRTDTGSSIYRASIASRGKKEKRSCEYKSLSSRKNMSMK